VAQSEHSVAVAGLAAALPATHGMHVEAPAEENMPLTQSVHEAVVVESE